MTVLAQLLIAAALVATAVIYGTDVFAAIVLRPALAHVDDRTLTGATGYMHDYADRRLPVPGAIGLAATVLGTAVAALAGHPGAVVAGGAAVLAMAFWLLIYRSVSAPVNRRLTAAAHDGRIPGDARALQRQWDRVINARAALQTAAVAALCAAAVVAGACPRTGVVRISAGWWRSLTWLARFHESGGRAAGARMGGGLLLSGSALVGVMSSGRRRDRVRAGQTCLDLQCSTCIRGGIKPCDRLHRLRAAAPWTAARKATGAYARPSS